MNNSELVDQIQSDITGEFFRIVGRSPDGTLRAVFGPLLHKPTRRFAEFFAEFDQLVADEGIGIASNRLLDKFTLGFKISGSEAVPSRGSLVVVSNHPGTFDLFTLLANLPRQDVKVIISGVPVVRSLPAAASYLIYVPSDPHGRIPVIRSAIRHLKQGGCLVLFPTGILDPDPEIMLGAEEAIEKWSRSLELFLRQVDNVRMQVAIVSGVLEASAMRSPLTMLVREPWKKQRLAEFALVAGKILSDRKFEVEPKISFAEPRSIADIESISPAGSLIAGVVSVAQDQLRNHLNLFPAKRGV